MGRPPIVGLWQGRLPEDHVLVQVGIRLEKVHLLGVTQEACILVPPGALGTLEPSLGTQAPVYFMAFPVGSSGSLGQSQSCQSFWAPSWGSLVRLPQRIVHVPSLPSPCFWLGAHCPDQWPAENTRQKFTDGGMNEWKVFGRKDGVEGYFRRLMTSSKGTKMETQELGWIAS